MAPAYRLDQILKWSAVGAAALAVLLAAHFVLSYQRLPLLPAARGGAPPAADAAEPVSLAADWTVFRGLSKSGSARDGLASRFTLLGTFFVYQESSEVRTPSVRAAILDDVKQGREIVSKEGDVFDGVTVVNVFRDHVVLRDDEEEVEIWNSIAEAGRTSAETGSGILGSAASGAAKLSFGETVGPNRWVLDREKMMSYYRELLDDPPRLLAAFDTMAPVYDERRKITGYVRNTVGEGDFFDAVGVEEGDVVKRVNQVEMSNRRRAEFFIKQFADDRLNVFVIDIERDGEAQKIIYQLK